ncbi:hypothetical protein E4T56_gene7897 [Termitomyces sp. T112]|nr:hypothetical protein E4T56_gene7897 [Termitomyces sp. T112]KAH0578665.1 hypothetical protein H2248_003797 [Termitomyces sp. 'cryptogamus']
MAPKRNWKPTLKSFPSLSALRQNDSSQGGFQIEEKDAIFLILGQTGAGKSTFVNHALGREAASVGHNLNAHTTTITPYMCPIHPEPNSGRIFLVDTPGFNDTWDSDRAIVKRILDWLQHSCKPKTKFGGIIYLYEISQARDNPTANFMHPTKLSEPEALKYVILATVKWSDARVDAAELRETQLKKSWSMLVERGSQMARFNDSTESAHQIINMFPKEALPIERIQKEFRRILGMLPAEASDSKEGFISKVFGKISWLR